MAVGLDYTSSKVRRWRAVCDDPINRGLRRPAFLIVDGTAGLTRPGDRRVCGTACRDPCEPGGMRSE